MNFNLAGTKLEKDFRELLDLAASEHKAASVNQVTALKTSRGNLYAFGGDVVGGIATVSIELPTDDTRIELLVCMWDNGCVDLPSYATREKLCRLNPDNGKTKILLQTFNGLRERELHETM